MVYRHKHTQKLRQLQQVQQIRMESALKVRSYEFRVYETLSVNSYYQQVFIDRIFIIEDLLLYPIICQHKNYR
mgnify:CR=1 FL=1